MADEKRAWSPMQVGWPRNVLLEIRPELEADLIELDDRIFDSASLEESLFWHDRIVERLDLEVTALLVSDDALDHMGIPDIRKLQASYTKQMERVRAAVAQSEVLNWL